MLQHRGGEWQLGVGASSGRAVRHPLCLCLPKCSAGGQGTCSDGLRGLKSASGKCSSQVEVLNLIHRISVKKLEPKKV